MKTRIITAAVALVILAPFLWFSDTLMLEVFVCVLSTIAVLEIVNCVGYAKKMFVVLPTAAFAFIFSGCARLIGTPKKFIVIVFGAAFVYMFYIMVASVFSKGNFPIKDAALIFMSTMYITFSFSCILLLRGLIYGQYIFLLVFMSAWVTDAGAYFVGIKFGRHKLIEDVSPKKTIEGAIGGVVVCVLAFCLYGFIVGKICEATPKYLSLCIVGAMMSVISQCGDLIASLIKRSCGIKDYGKIFPGHGGVMDRFDSIIANAPFLFILYSISSFFEIFF